MGGELSKPRLLLSVVLQQPYRLLILQGVGVPVPAFSISTSLPGFHILSCLDDALDNRVHNLLADGRYSPEPSPRFRCSNPLESGSRLSEPERSRVERWREEEGWVLNSGRIERAIAIRLATTESDPLLSVAGIPVSSPRKLKSFNFSMLSGRDSEGMTQGRYM